MGLKIRRGVGLWQGPKGSGWRGEAGERAWRRRRKRAGLSQERLAEKAELHPVYISQVECGLKAVSVEGLWKLARALGVTLARLMRGVG